MGQFNKEEEKEVKWNTYNRFGGPSVVLGLEFHAKLDHGDLKEQPEEVQEEIYRKIAIFHEEFLDQRNALLRNSKYMLASLSMAGYCFCVTGL